MADSLLYLGKKFNLEKYIATEKAFFYEDRIDAEHFHISRTKRAGFVLKKIINKTRALFSCFKEKNESNVSENISSFDSQVKPNEPVLPSQESTHDSQELLIGDDQESSADNEENALVLKSADEIEASLHDSYNENLPKRYFSKDPRVKEVPVVQPGIVKKLSPQIGALFGSYCSEENDSN